MYDLNFDNILLEEKSNKNVVYKNLKEFLIELDILLC